MNLEFTSSDPAVRALWAVIIIAAGLAFYWLLNRLILTRAQRSQDGAQPAMPGIRPGIPAIICFTTPGCAPCRTIQRPALQLLQEKLGSRLHVIEIDAQAQPSLARSWGVLSVPTTFIIDEHGRLRHVNHGAARAEKLLRQIQG